jgi:hypothetical protein
MMNGVNAQVAGIPAVRAGEIQAGGIDARR